MSLFTYDKKTARFRDTKGRFMDAERARGQIEKLVSKLEMDFRSIAKELSAGKSTVPEWQIKMRDLIKASHTLAGAVGRGGRTNMKQSDWGKVGAAVREQYKYLNKFARDVQNGLVSPAMLEYRASQYANAVRITFADGELQKHLELESEARRHQHSQDGDTECEAWAKKGWMPVKKMAPIGSLICKFRCKCTIEYRIKVTVSV